MGLVDLAYYGLGPRVAESQFLIFGRRRPDLALVVPDDVLDELLVLLAARTLGALLDVPDLCGNKISGASRRDTR